MGFGLSDLLGGGDPDPREYQIPTREKDAPVLSWDDDGTAVYIEIDCIPTFTDSRGGTITDFALEDGASTADHMIRKPQIVKFEINQTETPIDEGGNSKIEPSMELKDMALTLQENQFQAQGLYLLMTGAAALVGAAVDAIGGALGLSSGPPPLRAKVLQAKAEKSRINQLYDELTKAYDGAAQLTLTWLGRTWGPLVIESVDYSRQGGRELGVFSLTLKKVSFVSTQEASALQLPGGFGLGDILDAGIIPGGPI